MASLGKTIYCNMFYIHKTMVDADVFKGVVFEMQHPSSFPLLEKETVHFHAKCVMRPV